jgi:hypothetical protein
MISRSSINFCGSARYVIYYLKIKFYKHSKNSETLVKKVVQYTSGDFQKASLLDIILGIYTFIVFNYNNSDHLDNCKILEFRIRKSIKYISILSEMIYSTINRWKIQNKKYDISFPY